LITIIDNNIKVINQQIIIMTTFNALSFDILSRVLDYNSQVDISSLSLGCKQHSADIKSIGEMTTEKRIREKTNFIKTLGLYVDKYNNDSKQYIFDIPEIKEYLKSSHLNDKSLVVNGTDDLVVDGKMITMTTENSLHIENLIQTVIEFLPECAYSLVESVAYQESELVFRNPKTENMVYILINNETITTGYKSQIQKYQGIPVTVILGPNVTGIRGNAFRDCSSLTSVIIGNSVTDIGWGAFWNCTSLTSVIIGDSVTFVGYCAFRDCSSLTSVVIPDSVTSIEDGAFCDCSSLTSVVIPDSVTSLAGPDDGDDSTGHLSITGVFCNCTSLTSVIIPNSVTMIHGYTFCNCTSLTSVIIPNSVRSIYGFTFRNCTGLTTVIIPDSVTSIRDGAFGNCKGLTSIIIPNSVTSIGENAFSENTKIIRR
jgi:hypothetical protein